MIRQPFAKIIVFTRKFSLTKIWSSNPVFDWSAKLWHVDISLMEEMLKFVTMSSVIAMEMIRDGIWRKHTLHSEERREKVLLRRANSRVRNQFFLLYLSLSWIKDLDQAKCFLQVHALLRELRAGADHVWGKQPWRLFCVCLLQYLNSL